MTEVYLAICTSISYSVTRIQSVAKGESGALLCSLSLPEMYWVKVV